jgi:hypothetical protein
VTEPRFLCACGVTVSVKHQKQHRCGSVRSQRAKHALPKRTCDWAPCGASYQPMQPQQRFCSVECRFGNRNKGTAPTPEALEERAWQPKANLDADLAAQAQAAYERLIVGERSYQLWATLLGFSL